MFLMKLYQDKIANRLNFQSKFQQSSLVNG